MIKVVYSPTYGGFGLSDEAQDMYLKLKKQETFDKYDLTRHDPVLIKVVETLGTDKASSDFAQLKIVKIEGYQYRIDEYDGYESVETPEDDQRWIIADVPEARQKFPEAFL